MQEALRDVHQPNTTQILDICQDDKYKQVTFFECHRASHVCIHRDELVNHISDNQLSGSNEKNEIKEDIPKGKSAIAQKRQNLITIKDHNGNFIQIMTHTLYKEKVESLTMITHVRNPEYYFFVFVLKNTGDQQQVYQTFIFLRKTIAEMKTLFNNNLWTPLIGDLEEVPILWNANRLEMIHFEAIHGHQLSYEHNQIKLSLYNMIDESYDHNFIPFIYQEYQNNTNNQIVVFDIIRN